MQTQAYFEDIQLHILHLLKKARKTIHIAVAWFTDIEIFDLLCQKAADGVRVELIIINDSINRNSPIDYQRLVEVGGIFLMIGDKKRNSAMMHNKFCVIDAETVITGSFNWSKKAQENWENITVISEHPELAEQFIAEFEAILEHAASKGEGVVDYGKMLARIEALRCVVELDDEDDIALQVAKLKKLLPADESMFAEPREIIACINTGNIEKAQTAIVSYLNANKQMVVYADPEIHVLKVELKSLELQICALQSEKADIEKQMQNYHHRYNRELGEIVRRILVLRAAQMKKAAQENPDKQTEYQEAQNDSDAFQEDYEESLKQKQQLVTEAEAQELKALFRACAKMCHPDTVAAECKKEATELQKQLNAAYAANDIEAIRKIDKVLQQGGIIPISAAVSDAQKCQRMVVLMRGKVKNLSVNIYELRCSAVFRKVSGISDMDAYFNELKPQLQAELDALEAL